jgi:3-methylcrotonyl-CoA carboxylase alpha subunit
VRRARAAGYRNAGTVEFLLAPDGSFFFLEMNTRLQVEHPVTELVTGLDLVQLQLAVAAGEPLPFTQEQLRQSGHAIEVRVCAEDPLTYLPAAGQFALLALPNGPGVRNDAGAATGDEVTVYYDSLFAKLIVHGTDRHEAIVRLRQALDGYTALGVTTNLPLLRAIAAHPAFAAGETHTAFLEDHNLHETLHAPQHLPITPLAAAAVLDARGFAEASQRTGDPWQGGPWQLHQPGFALRYTCDDVEQRVTIIPSGSDWMIVRGDERVSVHVLNQSTDALALALTAPGEPERIERLRFAEDENDLLMAWSGNAYRLTRPAPPRLEGRHGRGAAGSAGLEAPMPGTVVRVLVAEGQSVTAHQPLVVLEAMKMEHTIAAPHDGVVRRIHYAAGALVIKGAALVELGEAFPQP